MKSGEKHQPEETKENNGGSKIEVSGGRDDEEEAAKESTGGEKVLKPKASRYGSRRGSV